MKKPLALLFIFLLLIPVPLTFAQMPMAVPSVAPAAGLERIGVVAATQGKVEIKRPVFMGDEVRTDAKGHLQILLLDQTVFTIGPNSAITIDKFVYDPKTQDGQIQASITKGVFRYVSGKIAAKRPNNVSVKLPTATIGFRGTIVGGQVNPGGDSLAALLGPGDNNDAGEQAGSFVMEGTGDNSGDSQEVNRTGFGVEAGADGSVSGAFQLSETQVNGLTSGLLPSGNDGDGGDDQGGGDDQSGGGTDDGGTGGGGDSGEGDTLGTGESASELSGEGTASVLGDADEVVSMDAHIDAVDDTTTAASQDQLDDSADTATGGIPDGATTLEQLRVATGIGHYDFSTTFYDSLSGLAAGTLTGKGIIDFGNQTIGGAGSSITITSNAGLPTISAIADGFGEDTNFSTISSGGRFTTDSFNLLEDGSPVGTATVTVDLSNQNGVIAQQATATATYTSTAGVGHIPSGSGTDTALLQAGS